MAGKPQDKRKEWVAEFASLSTRALSNTVNLREEATVEDVEDVYYQGWKRGLKALAISRNNCKVGQPLSDAREKKADVAVAATGEYKPVRKRLPKRRPSQTVSFAVA